MEMIRNGTRLFLAAMALVVTFAFANDLPNRPPYNSPISIRSVEPGLELDSGIRAIARAAGVQILTKDLPSTRAIFDFNKMPFRTALDLIVRIYAPDHRYMLLPEGIVVVAPSNALKGIAPQRSPTPSLPAGASATASLVLATGGLGKESIAQIAQSFNVQSIYVNETASVVLRGNASNLAQAAATLRELLAKTAKEAAPTNKAAVGEVVEKAIQIPQGIKAEELVEAAKLLGLEAVLVRSGQSLVVKGSVEKVQQFQALTAQFSPAPLPPSTTTSSSPPASTVATVALPANIKVDELTASMRTLFPGLKFAVLGKVLAVSGPPEQVNEATSIVDEAVKKAAENNPQRELITISIPSGVKEEDLKTAVQTLFPEIKVVVLGGVLHIDAPADRSSQVREVLKQTLSSSSSNSNATADGPPALRHPVKSYKIYGNPADIAKGLEGLFTQSYLAQVGASIQVLSEQKAVIVAAPIEIHRTIVETLRAIDPPTSTSNDQQGTISSRVEIQNLEAAAVATYLKGLGVEVEVIEEPSKKAIWLKGSPTEVARAGLAIRTADSNPPQVRIAVRVIQMDRSAIEELSGEVKASLLGLNIELSPQGVSAGYALPQNLARSLSLNFNALESKGRARTLLNTETLILDKKEGVLNSGGSISVVGQNQTQSSNNQTSTQTAFTNLDYGLILKLTPTVTTNPLGASIKTVIELGNLPTPGPIANSINISKRKLDAVLRLGNGETGLIGGLIQEEEQNNEQGVPILKDIPIIGALFRSTSTSKTERLLFIMVTPTVVDYTPGIQQLPAKEPSNTVRSQAPQDDRVPPEEAGSGKQEASPPPATKDGPKAKSGFSTSEESRPQLPELPSRAPFYSAQAYLSDKGLAMYVIGGATSPIAEPVRAYLVRKDANGRMVAALETPIRALRPTFGGGAMAVITLEATEGAVSLASAIVLVIKDELNQLWSLEVPIKRS